MILIPLFARPALCVVSVLVTDEYKPYKIPVEKIVLHSMKEHCSTFLHRAPL